LGTHPQDRNRGTTGVFEHMENLLDSNTIAFLDPETRKKITHNDDFNEIKKSAEQEADKAIQKLTNAILYYPTLEQLYLLRAEALRARSQLAVKSNHHSRMEQKVVTNTRKALLRQALSDIDHVLRFWDPVFLSPDYPLPSCDLDEIRKVFPEYETQHKTEEKIKEYEADRKAWSRDPDHYEHELATNAAKMAVQHKQREDAINKGNEQVYKLFFPEKVYAKAWLLRGNIRADLKIPHWECDFEKAQQLAQEDPLVYIAWGRALWSQEQWLRAQEKFDEGIASPHLEVEAKNYIYEEKTYCDMQQEAAHAAEKGCSVM